MITCGVCNGDRRLQEEVGLASNREPPDWGRAIFSEQCVLLQPPSPAQASAFASYASDLHRAYLRFAAQAQPLDGSRWATSFGGMGQGGNGEGGRQEGASGSSFKKTHLCSFASSCCCCCCCQTPPSLLGGEGDKRGGCCSPSFLRLSENVQVCACVSCQFLSPNDGFHAQCLPGISVENPDDSFSTALVSGSVRARASACPEGGV